MTDCGRELRIKPIGDDDVKACIAIISRAFSAFPMEQTLSKTETSNIDRHTRGWREHHQDTAIWPAIQCIQHDAQSGQDTTIACAEWFLHPRPTPRNDIRGASYIVSGTWLPSEERARVQQTFKPALDVRAKWTTGRGFGLLMYMATHPEWRRKGAATECVRWGIERCGELGIPAYLEASKEGVAVYEKLGFEVVDLVCMKVEGEKVEFPAMMWWPPGTREEDKRALVG